MSAGRRKGRAVVFTPTLLEKEVYNWMRILLLYKNFLIVPLSSIYVHIINIQKQIRTKEKTKVTIYNRLFFLCTYQCTNTGVCKGRPGKRTGQKSENPVSNPNFLFLAQRPWTSHLIFLSSDFSPIGKAQLHVKMNYQGFNIQDGIKKQQAMWRKHFVNSDGRDMSSDCC